MQIRKVYHCMVDDTALITNISEVEGWVLKGAITLIVPLHTLERLHLLKKDASQIGTNARKAVKFLDRMTSGKEDLPSDPVILQGPDEQYSTWAEVERHYVNESVLSAEEEQLKVKKSRQDSQPRQENEKTTKSNRNSGGALSQMLLDKLNFAGEPAVTSPSSTPPISPVSSVPQSSKTSPEVKSANLTEHDISPVPPALKPLLNPVVWYIHEKNPEAEKNVIFLTNSADTLHLARDFGIPTKNIHQLRSTLELEPDHDKRQDKHHKKRPATPTTVVAEPEPEPEPKPLFKYDENESDEEEEVVFKPRGRGSARGSASARGSPSTSARNKPGRARSPRLSFSTPAQPAQNKPQIPIEEIDPDSFDRGSFGRGSTPLVNTGNHGPNHANGFPRGPGHRGNFVPTGPSRGGSHNRGVGRGFDRGSGRGRGRLFVP